MPSVTLFRPLLLAGVLVASFLAGAWSVAPTHWYAGLKPREVHDLGLVLLPVPGGELLMGSATGEPEELPLTRVRLGHFWLGRTEVTQSQWQAVMGFNPSRFRKASHPVETITHGDALAFCARLTERERRAGRLPAGWIYALPTEAEWEWACRACVPASSAQARCADEEAWHRLNAGYSTHPVASLRPNAWGFHDMLGNVWEWCADYWGDYPGGLRHGYAGPARSRWCVRRGGSYQMPPTFCRPTARYAQLPRGSLDGLGLRVALVRTR